MVGAMSKIRGWGTRSVIGLVFCALAVGACGGENMGPTETWVGDMPDSAPPMVVTPPDTHIETPPAPAPDARPPVEVPSTAPDAGHDSAPLAPAPDARPDVIAPTSPDAGAASPDATSADGGAVAPTSDGGDGGNATVDRYNVAIAFTFAAPCPGQGYTQCGGVPVDATTMTLPLLCDAGHWRLAWANGHTTFGCTEGCISGTLCGPLVRPN